MAVLQQSKGIISSFQKKKKNRPLRFKSRSSYNSINYNQSGFRLLDSKTLKLAKIGKIRIVLHRQIQGKIKEIRIKRELTNQWYAFIITESEHKASCSLLRKKIVGIDVGINNFAYDSDGHIIEHPQFLKKYDKKLKRAQRKLSRKIKDSTNHWKQRLRISMTHQKIKQQRNDFLHKVSRYYVNNYDTIFVEDMNIQNMVKNHHLAKSISDSSWNSFFKKLEYKAERAGILFQKVSVAGTSQICSSCGNIVKKNLAIRTHCCPFCGLVIDRDHNASLVIKLRGMDSLPMVRREVTPVESRPLAIIKSDYGHVSSWNQEVNNFSR